MDTEQTFSITVDAETADALLAIAGITRPPDCNGRYIVPEDYRDLIDRSSCWQRDEATAWALRIIAEQAAWNGVAA